MSEDFQNEEIPSEQEIQERIQDAKDIKKRILEYIEKAEIINASSRSEDDDRYRPLEAVPYGEECIALADYPKELDEAIYNLRVIAKANNITDEDLIDKYDACDTIIYLAESKLDNCEPLPSEHKRESEEDEGDDDEGDEGDEGDDSEPADCY